jgi:UDP-N-acetylmuramate dehydrogenase
MLTRLPPVRGRYTEQTPLGDTSWFRCGGKAEVLFKPADFNDLVDFLKGCPEDIPVTVLGVCSNVIIRDGGIKGVVIKLGGPFAEIDVDAKTGVVSAGAAALDFNVAIMAQRAGRTGLEFFSGIPGSIGGALRMNAGAYGRETVDVLIEATTIDRYGCVRHYKPSEMDMSYRFNGIPENFIFTSARFATSEDTPEAIEARMAEIKEKRTSSQPIRAKTGGSTFANPTPGELANLGMEPIKAWQMIDKAGCRGLTIGGAQMSDLHCNFMLNTGNATSADLEMLGEEVRRRVKDMFGYELRWEIKRIGVSADEIPVVGNA